MSDFLQRPHSPLTLLFGSIVFLCSNTCFSQPATILKLNDVLSSVNRCYPQIKIARLETHIREGEYIQALGQFDPTVKINATTQPAVGYINQYGDAELQIPTFYNGLKVIGGYRKGNGDWPSYNQNYLTNSGGEYRLGISLPLLRDRLIDKERFAVWAAKETIEANRKNAEAIKIQVYQESIKAYWQWVQAGLQVQTLKQLRSLAQTRQNAIVHQAHAGDLPRLSITENLQQILVRDQLINQAKMIYQQAAVNLSIYYRDKNGAPTIPNEARLPHHLFVTSALPALTPAKLEQHPALQKIQTTIHIAEMKKSLAKNDILPNVDAVAYTYKQEGNGGNPLLIPTAAFVGVSLKFPLFQREAQGKIMSAGSEFHQKMAEKKFLSEQLKNQFTNLLIAIQTYHKQLGLLQTELKLARTLQVGETKKFNSGDSTLFLVNQREQATTQVQLNCITAKVKLAELLDQARFFSTTYIPIAE